VRNLADQLPPGSSSRAGPDAREVRYWVKRFEKSAYAVREPMAQKHLNPERLVPTNETFRTIAQQITRGKRTDMARARALCDHVIEKLRYAKYGSGWGTRRRSTPATPARAIARIFTPILSRWRARSPFPRASPLALPSPPSEMTAALTDTTGRVLRRL
jgi:hypothetical protein